VSTPNFAWLDGKVVPWDQCVLHARSQGAFWGANVFEGVRAYWRPEERQLTLFRMDDHLARLRRSMKCLHMEVAHTDAEILQACLDLVRANKFEQDVHVVVVAYFGMGERNFDPLGITAETGVHITAVPWPRSDGYQQGVSAGVSSWRRLSNDTMPPRIKTGANYHNSRLAQHEAVRNGFDTALILDHRGNVTEAPGACMMIVRDGRLATPPAASGVLEGITLATVAEIAGELGLAVQWREIDRTELHVADEIFLCGTVAEILPVVAVDRLPVGAGKPGPVTRALQERFDELVRASTRWATPVYADRLPA
jgi:branched-chain amino acid aminotransferase